MHEVIIPYDDVKDLNCTEQGQPLIINIEQLYDHFHAKVQDLTLYNYFESMCKLVSLMCLMRNNKGIYKLEKIYTLDFTIDSFLNENV